MNFWQELKKNGKKPFTVLAPMANVTDFAFRSIVAKCGRPDVFYTEFISCDGINAIGPERFRGELYFEKSEKPIVVQFFGSKPENFFKCAEIAREMGFDGIDINMGCPDRSVEKQSAGASLIKNPKLAQEIIRAAKEGGGDLPISVKTRLGYNKVEIEDWIPSLLKTQPAAVTIHGRTRKEMSKVAASWEAIGKVKEMVLASDSPQTLVIGNGDIKNLQDGHNKATKYNLDGIMVGRGIFENPWFFNPNIDPDQVNPKDRISLMTEHLSNYERLWGSDKRFDYMKKFFKVYISNWDGAKDLRARLMEAKGSKDAKDIVDEYLSNL